MPDIVKLDVRGEAAVDYAGVFRGRPDEVSRARGAVARYLVAGPGNWGVAGDSSGRVVWAATIDGWHAAIGRLAEALRLRL